VRSYSLSANHAENLEDIGYILERRSSALIRNYGGPGSLASISLHGTGSNHTQVTWNGMTLNSPTTGQADLSLIPASFIQTVEVIHGASGSLFGSGTFGGSVNLNNEPDWNNRLALDYSMDLGSYGLMRHLFGIKTGNKRFQYQLSAITSKADNNFTYQDHYLNNAPVVKNKHNAYKDLGVMQNMFLNLDHGNYLEAGFWYQQKSLEIPPLMGSYKLSHARQKDSLFRSFISYRKKGMKYGLQIRSAYFSDFLNYTDKIHADSSYSLNSKIATRRLLNEADYRFFLTSKLIAGGGMAYNYLTGESNNYGGGISENELIIYGNVKLVLKNLILNAGMRKEFHKGLNPQPQYAAGIRYKPADRIIIRSSFSTKFRKPSFNEKYWKPGGNPALRPEQGRGGEITFEWNATDKDTERLWAEIRITGFYQTVDNWIQWLVLDSLTPVEYKKVHARGFETSAEFGLNRGPVAFTGYINYNFNNSVIVSTFDDNRLSEGNQLIYIPRHSLRTSSDVAYRGLNLGFSVIYTGSRETVETADKTLRMPAFTLVDVFCGFRKEIVHLPLALAIRIENLFNQSYEVIRSFPMPGRTVHLALCVGFNKSNSENK
jgi:outer membrane cobalamin receptor